MKLIKFTLTAHLICLSLWFSVNTAGWARQNPDATLPTAALQDFVEVFERIRQEHVETVSDERLLELAMRGMLSGLDPYSAYLSQVDMISLEDNTQGQFSGIGIDISLVDDRIKIIAPIDDTPAQRAGIQSGDWILKINGQITKGLDIYSIVKLMRGKPGTWVTLSIMRDGLDEPMDMTIERSIIQQNSVRSKLLQGQFGYLRIAQFQDQTGVALHNHMQKLQDSGNVAGWIIDLRNNPGGTLEAAVAVADAFLAKGTIVTTRGRYPDSQLVYQATAQNPSGKLPVIALINGGSASAAEIVASAISDQGRGQLVGQTSFGKGSVQSIIPLSQGRGIKLTTAYYVTPGGHNIHERGITPQHPVTPSTDTSDPSLDRALALLDGMQANSQ